MTRKITLKNEEMAMMLQQLRPLLSRRDLFGYVAARNIRILSNCLTEYEQTRNDMIGRFGKEMVDDKTGIKAPAIKIDTPEFEEFQKAIEPFANIEHEVELMTVKYEESIGCLTGEEILSLAWMLEE